MRKVCLDGLLALARKAVSASVRVLRDAVPEQQSPWPLALDGTAGNGNDTEFLARMVEDKGLVLAFDIQPEAIAATLARLADAGLQNRARLIQENHDRLSLHVESGHKIAAAMYNLGYLPWSDCSINTKADSTAASLRQLVPLIVPGGVISVHCYTGQEQGEEELLAVQGLAGGLPWPNWRVARYEFCNKPFNREVLFLIQRVYFNAKSNLKQ